MAAICIAAICIAAICLAAIRLAAICLTTVRRARDCAQVPAICLAIVQNYTLSRTKTRWRLSKRKMRLDDELEPKPADFEHLKLLKQESRLERSFS